MRKTQTQFGDLFGRVLVHTISITMLLLLLSNSMCLIGSYFMGLMIATIGAFGTNEFYTLAQIKSEYPKKFLGTLGSFIFLLLSFLTIKFSHYFPRELGHSLPWIFLVGWTGILIFSFKKLLHSPVINVGITLFGILYLGFPLKLVFEILYGFSIPEWPNIGVWLTGYLICVTKGSDIFGYFFGKAFGKTRITPLISPKKTVVGLIFGIMGSGLIAGLFSTIVSKYYIILSVKQSAAIIFMGMLLGFTGFIGDLGESIFKRDALVKDSYSFKSVGGILDNVDSLLFTIPVFYIFLKIGSLFGWL